MSFQFNTNVFADVDVGDTLSYTATDVGGSALPSWLTFNAATRTFSGTPTAGDSNLTVTVIAMDTAGATQSNSFNIRLVTMGGSGPDTVVGNSAANILYGGTGAGVKDTLTGNGGADTFVCSLADAVTTLSLADVISDFTNGTDLIGLEDRVFTDLTLVSTKNIFSTTGVLTDQIKKAVEDEVGGGTGFIKFKVVGEVNTSIANKAPENITLNSEIS